MSVQYAARSKLAALRLIDVLALPHPNWLFTRAVGEVPERPWAQAYAGWTVRCAPSDRYAFCLPSRHQLDYADVSAVVSHLLANAGVDCCVVYPSWRSRYSGNCLIGPEGTVVEAVAGEIAPLLRGRVTPDIVVTYASPDCLRSSVERGDVEDMGRPLLARLAAVSRELTPVRGSLTLEWVSTHAGGLLFYDSYGSGDVFGSRTRSGVRPPDRYRD